MIAVVHPMDIIPLMASNPASNLAPECNVISPYPRVVNVTREKYNASVNVENSYCVLGIK